MYKQLHVWKDDRENRSNRRETCPSAILSHTNPTWVTLGLKPGLHSDRPATNSLSHNNDSIRRHIRRLVK
jgi:hypothetical protein